MRVDIKKNLKLSYYALCVARLLIPGYYHRALLPKLLESMRVSDYMTQRVNYYNKIEDIFSLPSSSKTIHEFKEEKKKTYYFDLLEFFRFFEVSKKVMYLFGDLTKIPDNPSFVKSRPIAGENKNSVLMKLDKVRHFIFVADEKGFEDKKHKIVWRGAAHNLQRQRVIQEYFNRSFCDVAQSRKKDRLNEHWYRGKLTLKEQLQFKFILSIEGHDVASNLKWIMSSNSLAFMPKPKYETWFMEGRLIEDQHYVLIKDDFSDLEEKVDYYIQNTAEAKKIISNANVYVNQFRDKKRERDISLLVLQKYFEKSGQLLKES
ncbi:MAG: lipopolysaccharide A protein [Xanthomonadales bacterium]|nr:lipopolysaccharide A protein [Xanthomonadales bacterium]